MKKIIWITLIGLILSVQLYCQELKITGEMWNRWTLENGKAPGDSSNIILKNYFSLERGYIGLEPKFSETIKGRFTVDIFSSDLIKDGAGLKLKYAYVDFSHLIPVPDLTTTVGLQKVYFGTIYDWSYDLIGKAPSDEYKIVSSSDYGITFNGYIPQGWGEYALGIYNGEGYKSYGANLKDNINPSLLVNLRLTPIQGLTLGGSVMTNSSERNPLLSNNSPNPNYNDQLLFDGLLRLAYGPVDIWIEYINKDVKYAKDFSHKDYTANCLSVFPTLKMAKFTGIDFALLGRYDRWNETDNPSNPNLLNSITAGLNYNFMHDESANPAMQLQLNYIVKTYDEDESSSQYANKMKDSQTLLLQYKWRFNNTIKL
jgi:hypothetical protein